MHVDRPGLPGILKPPDPLEQPLPRERALESDVGLAGGPPLLIDESDDDLGVFPAARARGYLGVSAKSCKGLYKALVNQARCRVWSASGDGPGYFMSAEEAKKYGVVDEVITHRE